MKEALNIQLIAITLDEVEAMTEVSSVTAHRNFDIASGALPPAVVLASALVRYRAGESWFWCAPRLFELSSEKRIIGSGCFKNSPHGGIVEIGCGVAESYRGRGFATQGVRLLVAEGLSKTEVTAITAETANWNCASQRVLEKATFKRIGSRVDPEDGHLIIWQRERVTRLDVGRKFSL